MGRGGHYEETIMASEYKKITHSKGTYPTDYFIVKDAGGSAIDIEGDGWAVSVSIRRSGSASVLESLTTANGKVVLSTTTTGRFDFSGMDGTEFADVTFRGLQTEFVYDIQLTDDSGVIYDAYHGDWILKNNL